MQTINITDKFVTDCVKENKSRSSNFELLRVICMLLIISEHIVMVRGHVEVGSLDYFIDTFTRSFCIVAANVYVLISGYFGLKLNVRKLIGMNWMVTFYSVLFLIVSMILGIHTIALRIDLMQFFPVLTRQYWFITTYFVLCLASPLINILVEQMDKVLFQKVLLVMFCMFSLLPTIGYIVYFDSITRDSGYGIVNFIFLYLIGRYIRLYYKDIHIWRWGGYLIGYCGCMLVLGIVNIIKTMLTSYSNHLLVCYDTVFVLIGSVLIFLFFRKLNFDNKLINWLSSKSLAVYVIHINPLLFGYLFIDVFHVRCFSGISYIALILLLPLFVYLVSCVIEMCRLFILHRIKHILTI